MILIIILHYCYFHFLDNEFQKDKVASFVSTGGPGIRSHSLTSNPLCLLYKVVGPWGLQSNIRVGIPGSLSSAPADLGPQPSSHPFPSHPHSVITKWEKTLRFLVKSVYRKQRFLHSLCQELFQSLQEGFFS